MTKNQNDIKYLNLRVPKSTFTCLKKRSIDLDMTMTDLANFALEKYLKNIIKNNNEKVLTP